MRTFAENNERAEGLSQAGGLKPWEKNFTSPSDPKNRRRSERVMLQMKVTVIAEDTERKPRQEEALTLVVNAHGGLLKMKMDLHVGQPRRLANTQKKRGQNWPVIPEDDTSPHVYS